MRNLFDQYSQQENRLTHALASCLAEDPRLLRRFVKWVTNRAAPSGLLRILEQSVPWVLQATEAEAEAKGLPDAWICTEDGWALVIESKIAANASAAQLKRHRETAIRHGWKEPFVLLLDAKRGVKRMPSGVISRRWSELYEWVNKEASDSQWARRLKDYMEVLEGRLVADEYLKDGALTMFSGIPFNPANSWNYVEAKRLLRLVTEELRTRRRLATELKVDLQGSGRKAITGREGDAVWDFLPLQSARRDASFTQSPHFTIAIEYDCFKVAVTVPHGIKSAYRRNLTELGADGFVELIKSVNHGLNNVMRKDKGAVPWIIMVQRRYPTQRSQAIIDAKLEFDLRTAFGGNGRGRAVRLQPQWLEAAYQSLARKRSNLQFQIGATFPYSRSNCVSDRTLLDRTVETWLACKPLLKAMGAL